MEEKSVNPPDSGLDDQGPDDDCDEEPDDDGHQDSDDDCCQAPSLTPLAIPLIIEELMGGNISCVQRIYCLPGSQTNSLFAEFRKYAIP